MASEIRACQPGEVGLFLQTCQAAFGGRMDDETAVRLARVLEPDRLFVVWDDGVAVGSAGSIRFDLSVPGGSVAAAAVTMVGVLPGYRRRGLFRALMSRVLVDARARGEPLSVLWSTEGDLYRQFGFGLSALAARLDVARDRARLRDSGPAAGRVRLVDVDEAVTCFPAVYDPVRTTTPAMAARSEEWWRSFRLAERREGPPMCRALLETEGVAEAYALYRLHGSWELGVSTARLEVIEAMALTPRATDEIWRFLFGLDLVERVRALHLPVDHALILMAREPARLRVTLTDALWTRLIDARAALSARSYAGEGAVVLELADPLCPWNEGRWLLEAGPGGASVEPTNAAPDLALTAEDLGSVYLGGFTFQTLLRAGRTEERRAGVAERLDALFRTPRAPWCPEEF